MAKSRKLGPPQSRSAAVEVDQDEEAVVVEEAGMGMEEALGIVTTLLLIAAILFTDYELGKQFGSGVFFK